MANPSSVDAVLRRLSGLTQPRPMAEAARDVAARGADGWRRAEALAQRPEDLARVDEFLGDHGMVLGDHLGAGVEAVVWEALPRAGGNAQVLKVRAEDPAAFFDLPENVAGVSPYWAKADIAPNLAVALQERADAVYRPGRSLEAPFKEAAERVNQSLLARGWQWDDRHRGNLGVMPNGSWGVFDGYVKPLSQGNRPAMPAEEAIRMLRLTPAERAAIYGTELRVGEP